MMQYVRSLEQQVKTLEEEKRLLCQKLCSAGINPDQERSAGWDLVDPVRFPFLLSFTVPHFQNQTSSFSLNYRTIYGF